METVLKGEQIKELIPQREPILMVDTFYGYVENEGYTGLTVDPDNLFCRQGTFMAPGLIEHIAQSASVFLGYTAREKQTTAGGIGYIGEIRNFRQNTPVHAGDEVRTTIRIVSEVMGIILISAEVACNGKPVASCRMKIASSNP